MVKEYKKGEYVELSLHFKLSEFDCHCSYENCTYTLVDTDLVKALEKLRKKNRAPLIINRGYSCSAHNKDIGGKPGSFHLCGKAVDIKVEGQSPSSFYYMVASVPEFSEGGIGNGATFIHADVRGYKSRWSY